ncbi:MAG: zinc ribbon domain-containing protein [Clostridia bacterium]|nr:zinc ribbon domain-containing protein [Clostridia bacterium]
MRSRAKTCFDCGERLPKETLFDRYKRKHLKCQNCDTVLTADSLYCSNCGNLLIKGEKTI